MRQVLAIHRHGSFVRAAEEVGVAQPTLSKSIARLEDELGLKLFERSGTGAKVTPMGAILVSRAETIIAEAERLERDIELTAAGQIGEARIGLGPGLRAFLPDLAEAIAARYPALRLKLNVDMRSRVLADLRAGALDLVVAAYAPDLPDDYVQTRIVDQAVIAVASPRHPLARRRRISLDEFVRYPTAAASDLSMLTPAGAEATWKGFRQEAQIVCNDDDTLKQLARRGLSTLLIPEPLVADDITSGELVRLPLEWARTVTMVAVMTRATSHSPVFQDIATAARTALTKRP